MSHSFASADQGWSTSWGVATPAQKSKPLLVKPTPIPHQQPQQELSAQDVEAVTERLASLQAFRDVNNVGTQNAWSIGVNASQQDQPEGDDEAEFLKNDKDSKQNLYKTELCRSWMEKGICRYGHKCQFAHGEHELRNLNRHPKYKTEACRTFTATGNCPYGNRCRFIHPKSLGGRGGPVAEDWSNDWSSAASFTKKAGFASSFSNTATPAGSPVKPVEPRSRLSVFQQITPQ